MRNEIEKYDIITNVPIPIKEESGYTSVLDYCKKNPQGYKMEDINVLREVILEKYPDDISYFDSFFKGRENRWYNCYIMKKNVFHEYANWLFDILFEFEKRIDVSSYTEEQLRVFGVMAERLWGVFLKKRATNYSICEKQLVFFQNTEFVPAFPASQGSSASCKIPIVIPATSDEIPLTQALIKSILKHKNSNKTYQIIILHNSKTLNTELFQKMVSEESEIRVEQYNVSHLIEKYKLKYPNMGISNRDLLWFSALEACRNFEHIFLLSPYTMVRKDLTELLETELDDAFAGAPYNYQVMANCYQSEEYRQYFSEKLHQNEQWLYYNFECSIINLSLLTKKYPATSFLGLAYINSYLTPFVDAMNSKLAGNILPLDTTFGTVADIDGVYCNLFRWFLPYQHYQGYKKSYMDPSIVYFDSQFLPWTNLNVDFAKEFWENIRGSMIYEDVLARMVVYCSSVFSRSFPSITNVDQRTGVRKLADKLLPKGTKRRRFAKIILPKGSLRWKLCKQIYYIFKPQYRPIKKSKNA